MVIEELTDTSQDSGHTEDQEMGTPAKGKEPILVDTDLRCSDRLKGHRKGYKSTICTERNCLGCDASSPIIPDKVLRNLGEDFCKIKGAKINEEELTKKRKPGTAIGQSNSDTSKVPAKASKKAKDNSCKNADKTSKKSRK